MISVAVYRVNKNRGYTVMANFHLRDKSLSLKAVGLLSKMLSFNDGWKFSTKGLSAICKEGPDAILSALRELMFIGLVRKYTRARKLTPRMLNELIEKIEVFNAEKIDGVWEQRLRIHYNCVGTIEIPTVLPLPIPEVSVNTRKGVVVNYAPCELAV